MIDRHMSGDTFIEGARPELMNGLSHYVDALDEGPFAAENIVDALQALYREGFEVNPILNQSQPREIRILREHEYYREYEYIRQKLGLSKDLVEKTLATYKRTLGRFKEVSCMQISDSVFLFST